MTNEVTIGGDERDTGGGIFECCGNGGGVGGRSRRPVPFGIVFLVVESLERHLCLREMDHKKMHPFRRPPPLDPDFSCVIFSFCCCCFDSFVVFLWVFFEAVFVVFAFFAFFAFF